MINRRQFLVSSSGLALASSAATAKSFGSAESHPQHGSTSGEQIAARLLDWQYLEDRIRTAGVFALIDDFHDGIDTLSLDRPARRLLLLIREAIRRETMFLAQYPDRFFQCLWNSGWWYDGPLTSVFLAPVDARLMGDAPWNRAEPKLSTWLEQWRVAREAARPGEVWVRALTPPELPLGAGHIATLTGHRWRISCLAFSRDGRWLASGSYDRTVLWDIRHGEPRHLPGRTGGTISCVAFSPNGQRLAASASDGEVLVWDVELNQHMARWSAHSGMVRCLVWSPDGESLWSGGDSEIACWQPADGRQLRRWALHADRGQLRDLSMSENICLSAIVRTDGVWLIDLSNGNSRQFIKPEDDRIETAILSPDGRLLLTRGFDDCSRMWDIETGEQLWDGRPSGSKLAGHFDDWSVAFTSDSRAIIAAALGGTIDVLDSWSGTRRPTGLRIGEAPSELIVSTDGKTLAAVEGNGVIRLLDLQHCDQAPVVRPEFASALSWAESSNGRWLVVGSSSGSLILWDLTQGEPIELWLPAENWNWEKARLAELHAWKSDSVERFVSHLAITSDGEWIGIADCEHHIKLLDRREGARLYALRGHADDIRGLKFSEDGRLLASHSADGTVRLWHCDTQCSILCLPLSDDSDAEERYFFTGDYFLVKAIKGQQFAFDIDTAEFCTDATMIRELFANQTRSTNGKKADRTSLARSLSEPFEFAKAAHGPQTLAMQFQRLSNHTAPTWLCEFSEPPQLLRLEGDGASCPSP